MKINSFGEKIASASAAAAVEQTGMAIRDWFKDRRKTKKDAVLDSMTIDEIEIYLEQRKQKQYGNNL